MSSRSLGRTGQGSPAGLEWLDSKDRSLAQDFLVVRGAV